MSCIRVRRSLDRWDGGRSSQELPGFSLDASGKGRAQPLFGPCLGEKSDAGGRPDPRLEFEQLLRFRSAAIWRLEKQDIGGKAELLWLSAKGSGIWLLGLTFDMRGSWRA